MKKTNTNTAATVTECKVSKQIANALARAEHVDSILAKGDDMTPAERAELILILARAVKYHDSGKIEGIFSLDVSCLNCEFCKKMQAAGQEDPTIICGSCYTKAFYQIVHITHEMQGKIISRLELTDAEASLIAVPGTMCRFDCDGELINLTHAMNLLKIASAHPLTTFTVWTKRPAILDAAIKAHGKPVNLVCGVSSPIINTPFSEKWTWCDFIFTVYTPAGMEKALARGEIECNGKKCMACGFRCYTRPEKQGTVYIAEALRKPAKKSASEFAEMIKRIDAATLE